MTQAEIDRLRTAKIAPQQLLIGGGWRASESEAAMEVISPIDGKAFTSIASGSKADTEAAIAAARQSFERGVWRNMPPMARKAVLLKQRAMHMQQMACLARLAAAQLGNS